MFQRILVPVDGSTFSEHAIPYATSIAAASQARLELALVHIHYRPITADLSLQRAIDEWERDHRHREADYLHELAGRVEADCGRTVDPVMLNGDIVPALEREVKQMGVSLVVMTTHGRTGLERAWLGSVADALVRHVDAPVLLIRPSDDEPLRDDGAPHFRHVLIALDGSRLAERAIAPARALAHTEGARITLLRIIAPPRGVTSPFLPHAVQIAREQTAEREREARAYIDRLVQQLELEGVDASGQVLRDPQPAHAIVQYAAGHDDVDLIALGTHGRGPLRRFVLGSVTDEVAREADVPVLVC
jgi:nucleotide-binding universal stress UspA family protein